MRSPILQSGAHEQTNAITILESHKSHFTRLSQMLFLIADALIDREKRRTRKNKSFHEISKASTRPSLSKDARCYKKIRCILAVFSMNKYLIECALFSLEEVGARAKGMNML